MKVTDDRHSAVRHKTEDPNLIIWSQKRADKPIESPIKAMEVATIKYNQQRCYAMLKNIRGHVVLMVMLRVKMMTTKHISAIQRETSIASIFSFATSIVRLIFGKCFF